MKIQFVIALGCSALFASAALGQISSFTLESKENTVRVTFNTPKGVPAPVVIGAPYSADQVIGNVQTLADGAHVDRGTSVRHIVRDSQGRTRTERPLLITRDENGWNLTVIEIRDPVDGLYTILDLQNKVAHRFATPWPAVSRQVAAPQTPSGTPSKPPADGKRPENSFEKLGSQMMEGVMVEGARSTTTWPVGAQGNDRPIVTIHESWYSQELKAEVLMKNSDPRSGENTFKLTNIERTEPDPALLLVPPDYTVVDEKSSFTMTAIKPRR